MKINRQSLADNDVKDLQIIEDAFAQLARRLETKIR